MDYNELVNEKQAEEKDLEEKGFFAQIIAESIREIEKILQSAFSSTIDIIKGHLFKVEVTNQIEEVSVKNFPDVPNYQTELENVLEGLYAVERAILESKVEIPEVKIPEYPKEISVKNFPKVEAPVVNVKEQTLDTSKLEKQIADLIKEVKKTKETKITMPTIAPKFEMKNEELLTAIKTLENKLNIPETDLKPLIEAVNKSTQATKDQRFPVPNFSSSWQHSLSMQAEDLAAEYTWITVAGKSKIETKTFTANDGNSYRKTYSYDTNGNIIAQTKWEKQ